MGYSWTVISAELGLPSKDLKAVFVKDQVFRTYRGMNGITYLVSNLLYKLEPGETTYILQVGEGGLSLSHDGGRTWISSPEPLFTENYALSLYTKENQLYVGTSEGIVIYDLLWE